MQSFLFNYFVALAKEELVFFFSFYTILERQFKKKTRLIIYLLLYKRGGAGVGRHSWSHSGFLLAPKRGQVPFEHTGF